MGQIQSEKNPQLQSWHFQSSPLQQHSQNPRVPQPAGQPDEVQEEHRGAPQHPFRPLVQSPQEPLERRQGLAYAGPPLVRAVTPIPTPMAARATRARKPRRVVASERPTEMRSIQRSIG